MARATTAPGVPADPVPRIARFCVALRSAGMSVGVGAEVDLAHALEHTGVLDRGTFRDACRATLAKSPEDLAILDAAFEVFWVLGFAGKEPERAAKAPRPRTTAERRIESVPPRPITPAPTGTTRHIALRLGVYSPDALPGGHPLRAIDARRLAAFRASGL